jgi:superfamily II DNA or RNA helicase
MAQLEDLTRGASVKGILADRLIKVLDVKWHGSNAIELTYEDPSGRVDRELVYRDQEPMLEVIEAGQPWSFDGDGALLRLVSEAYRIRLAHLFDPLLAVHTSILDPLPHQITGVYGEMLTRQPLRYLLADDPGAGKTIMAGLLIKELIIRGDVRRCLVCCPGSLVDQWQDELFYRFQLPFEIITRDKIESSHTGNPFAELNLIICRLDHLSRNEDLQAKLEQTDWDLIICDEAHKMSATFFSGEVKYTKRYRLGQLLARLTRHFLLLTATPHNGKEEDFQLFMALLDGDRFEGRFRDGAHVTDVSDLMRRLVKEQLLKFDGTPLFPERLAYTVNYELSPLEADLYRQVTEYVREEMNRAQRLAQEGEGRRSMVVGFALTILQRRLASSPEAIYQSLRRRRERLEKRLREEKLLKRGAEARLEAEVPAITEETIEDIDDAPDAEVEEIEEEVVDQASAARTIAELAAEIETLKRLENLAQTVRRSGTDKKWEELSGLLQGSGKVEASAHLFDSQGHRRKLVIFTEHKDTLTYLDDHIRSLLGRPERVVVIHGGLGREDRKKAQEAFTQDKEVMVLVATDAAGEGINLQRAHLMVNYDLPWNPNRLEQRFGRIHRIGQTEVCHLWNLVADETREGDVFRTLLKKLEEERRALGGKVFDVLGRLFQEKRLRDLLIEAIRYGDQPEVKERVNKAVADATQHRHIVDLLEERALAHDTMDASRVRKIKEDMERAEAQRLQPHFISSFFIQAFRLLGGTIRERETKRYEITHVPGVIRSRDRVIGLGQAVLTRYERVTFEKDLITEQGKPLAAFLCPGHPLLDATIDLILERYRDLLKRGALLVDPTDQGEAIRALFYLEHAIQDGKVERSGLRRVISKRMQFTEIDSGGTVRSGGTAPYLDYRPVTPEEKELITPSLELPWLRGDLEGQIKTYAVSHLVLEHLTEVRTHKEELVKKTMAAVHDRLTKEIAFWDHRSLDLQEQELAGRINARINSAKARQRADDLEDRLRRRMEELEQERRLSPQAPVVIGGALVIPAGLLARLKGERAAEPSMFARETAEVERLAMEAVMVKERRRGREPVDVSQAKCGYDIESKQTDNGKLFFIEVKGRIAGAPTVTITRNEILTAFNKPEEFILAIVEVTEGSAREPVYLQRPFQREPDFGVTSVNYDMRKLLRQATTANEN